MKAAKNQSDTTYDQSRPPNNPATKNTLIRPCKPSHKYLRRIIAHPSWRKAR